FRGQEAIEVSINQPTTTIKLHAMQLQLTDVTFVLGMDQQRATVAYDEPNEMVALTVPHPIQPGLAAIHIVYTGILNNNLRGLYLGEAMGRRYASTQFEAAAARYA